MKISRLRLARAGALPSIRAASLSQSRGAFRVLAGTAARAAYPTSACPRSNLLSAINVTPVRDDSHDDFARGFVGEVENSIITHANAPAVAILELLAASWKGSFSSESSTRATRFCTALGSRANSFFASRARPTRQLTRESEDPSAHRATANKADSAALRAQGYLRGHLPILRPRPAFVRPPPAPSASMP